MGLVLEVMKKNRWSETVGVLVRGPIMDQQRVPVGRFGKTVDVSVSVRWWLGEMDRRVEAEWLRRRRRAWLRGGCRAWLNEDMSDWDSVRRCLTDWSWEWFKRGSGG